MASSQPTYRPSRGRGTTKSPVAANTTHLSNKLPGIYTPHDATMGKIDAVSCLKNALKGEKEKIRAVNKRSNSECSGGVLGLEAFPHGKGRLKWLVVAGGLPSNLRRLLGVTYREESRDDR